MHGNYKANPRLSLSGFTQVSGVGTWRRTGGGRRDWICGRGDLAQRSIQPPRQDGGACRGWDHEHASRVVSAGVAGAPRWLEGTGVERLRLSARVPKASVYNIIARMEHGTANNGLTNW